MSKPITQKNKSHTDSMTIGAGHSILMSNVPEVIQAKDNLTNLTDNFFAWNNTTGESVQSLGFWSDIDYNTYYPDLKLEDLKPKEDEFITPMFRLLSETIVSKNYNPTDFSQGGVLKASMSLLLGQTVNCDHETNIGNAIGAVSKVVWQSAYKDGKFSIPGGINGILKIDGKANPRIARGILMDPPSIHSNSVTVQFKWDKSHPEMDEREFYEKLGTYDKNGNMVRRIVTEIIRYAETSLVSHGADSFAQKIGADGKIINPTYATRVWNSYEEYRDDKAKQYFFSDTKTTNYIELDNTPVSNNEDDTIGNIIQSQLISNNTNPVKNINMTKQEFLALMAKLNYTVEAGQVVKFGEDSQMDLSDILTIFKSVEDDLTNKETTISSLNEKIKELNEQVVNLQAMANIGTATMAELRETVVANYKKIQGDKFDEKDPVFVMLNDKETPVVTLKGLNTGYEQKLNEMFPMKCSHCGSTDLTRASSVEEPKQDPSTVETHNSVVDNAQATANILARKNKYQVNN